MATQAAQNQALGKHAMSFVAGLLFAIGLVLSGMTQPGKVVGFLDVFGDWDPALMGVMGGGILVHMLLRLFVMKRARPVFALKFFVPTRKDIDKKLVGGAVLFGLGWGIAGFCPGPALVSIGTWSTPVLAFTVAMLAGMALERKLFPR